MTINTKFNIWESAYLIYENKIEEVNVESIMIRVKKNDVNQKKEVIAYVDYNVREPGKVSGNISEKDLFKTKKEAVREMIKKIGYEVSEDDLIETTKET